MNSTTARWTIARWGPIAAAVLILAPTPGTAQDISQEWTGPSNLSLELTRPFFDGGDFTVVVHDGPSNTFRIGDQALRNSIAGDPRRLEYYLPLQPGHFDPTSQGSNWIE